MSFDNDSVATNRLRHFWHPFTQMQEYARLPQLDIVRGEGCWLFDANGNAYLDANASIWTNTLGHNDPDINATMIGQLEQVAHTTALGLGNPTTQALAARLAGLTSGSCQRVFFSDNGSNAVEIALKLSFQYWQLTGKPSKQRVIAMTNAYHGDTFGTMAVGDCGGFHERFAHWCFPVDHFPAPTHEQAGGIVRDSDTSASLSALEALLIDQAAETACVVIEPWVQGAGGMCQQPAGFVKAVSELCTNFNVHLVLDEVFVAFGRLGHMLVCEAEGVQPDFLCLAKGLTAGYLPLAATLTTDTIYEAFLGEMDQWKAFYHGHTFTGNPLACAVALKNIEKVEALLSSGELEQTLFVFEKLIRERCLDHPAFAKVSQRGLTARLNLPEGFPVNDRVGMQVCLAAREHGVILRPLGDSLLIVPPLVIDETELNHLFDGVIAATETVMHAQQQTV